MNKIMIWLKSIFHKPVPKLPLPGEQWDFKSTIGDPWGQKSLKPVLILDAKDGWVRYRIGSIFDDERMEISVFVDVFEYHETEGN